MANEGIWPRNKDIGAPPPPQSQTPQKLLCEVLSSTEGTSLVMPRPVLRFSSIPPTSSALDLGSTDVSEAHSLQSTNSPVRRIPQKKQSKAKQHNTTQQPQQIPKPRGADADECRQEVARKTISQWIQQVTPHWRPGRQGSGSRNLSRAASAGARLQPGHPRAS